MDVAIELCADSTYAGLLDSLGGLAHSCPLCGSTQHGRPRVASGYISISHNAPLHVVALAAEPIGVDAEAVGSGTGIDGVALHPNENAELARLSGADRTRAVLEIWVAKEAVLELLGVGLQVAPESFAVRHPEGWYVGPGVLGSTTINVAIEQAHGLVLAVASFQAAPHIVIRRRDG